MSAASGSLPRYILIRLLLVIPMMWVMLTVVFFLLRVAPGDPVTAAVGGKLDEEALDQRRAALGLDRPLIVQYLDYLGDVARFDFGNTISDNRPVIDIIRDQGGATLTLTLGAFLIALLIGLPLGRLAGRYRDTAARRGHPRLRRGQLRRADLLDRHHADPAGGGGRSRAGRPTTSRRSSPSSRCSRPRTSCWSTP